MGKAFIHEVIHPILCIHGFGREVLVEAHEGGNAGGGETDDP